jgi:hypothetical protein
MTGLEWRTVTRQVVRWVSWPSVSDSAVGR